MGLKSPSPFEKNFGLIYNSDGEAMSEKRMRAKQIPYGISNFERIVQKNCYYVDKTRYLRAIEDAGDYLFFIRPRRFGKTLFLSVMEAYYDVYYKDRFEELFKETAILGNPTSERGAYLILKLNFSEIDPGIEKIEESFLLYMREKSASFLSRYKDSQLPDIDVNRELIEIKKMNSPSDILRSLINRCKMSGRKLYVIIDEYDNFANTILSTTGEDAYKTLTHGEGFFRSFFNVLKGGTSDMGAPITRLFITGVSPITLDDVTSGYNIGKNISLDPQFNRMLGFTKDDVAGMIEYYRAMQPMEHQTDELLEIMTQWYGNYLFSEDDDVRLFNSDMVLYFLDYYLTREKLPKNLMDRNVRIDYRKLRHLIIIDQSEKGKKPVTNGNFSRLKQLMEEGETLSELVEGFPLEQLTDTRNFISLLFYFGLLTIDAAQRDKIKLKIPNETVRRLHYDYLVEGYRETDVFDLDLAAYSNLMSDMAYEGKWEPLIRYITGRMRESMSLRDLITGEKSIQAFLNVYLGLSHFYIIHAEKESNKGYADIVMEPFLARYEGIKYSYLLEIKYIKSGRKGSEPAAAAIEQLKTEARDQLKKYCLDEKLKKSTGNTTLIKLILIFSGHELVYIGEA